MTPSPRRTSRLLVPAVALAVLVADQATKAWVVSTIALRQRITVIPDYFDLTYVTNPGGVWSVGSNLSGTFRTGIFLALPVAITAFAIWYSWSLPARATGRRTAIALVVGGAIGNLVDRLFRSPPEVVDFLLAHWRNQKFWPAFNVADSAICVGVAILLIASFMDDDEEDEPAPVAPAAAPP